jgi:hypothetical protein
VLPRKRGGAIKYFGTDCFFTSKSATGHAKNGGLQAVSALAPTSEVRQ